MIEAKRCAKPWRKALRKAQREAHDMYRLELCVRNWVDARQEEEVVCLDKHARRAWHRHFVFPFMSRVVIGCIVLVREWLRPESLET